MRAEVLYNSTSSVAARQLPLKGKPFWRRVQDSLAFLFRLRETWKRNSGVDQFLNGSTHMPYGMCGHDSNSAPLFAIKQSPRHCWPRDCFMDLLHCFNRISRRGVHLPFRGVQPGPRGGKFQRWFRVNDYKDREFIYQRKTKKQRLSGQLYGG